MVGVVHHGSVIKNGRKLPWCEISIFWQSKNKPIFQCGIMAQSKYVFTKSRYICVSICIDNNYKLTHLGVICPNKSKFIYGFHIKTNHQ